MDEIDIRYCSENLMRLSKDKTLDLTKEERALFIKVAKIVKEC